MSFQQVGHERNSVSFNLHFLFKMYDRTNYNWTRLEILHIMWYIGINSLKVHKIQHTIKAQIASLIEVYLNTLEANKNEMSQVFN